jgi:hypothetical protein
MTATTVQGRPRIARPGQPAKSKRAVGVTLGGGNATPTAILGVVLTTGVGLDTGPSKARP